MENNEAEEWRVSPSFPSYDVSSLGRVRRNVTYRAFEAGRMCKQQILKNGYPYIAAWKNSVGKTTAVHVLVAEAFIGPRPAKFDVNHKDKNRANNRVENLEYCSRAENIRHAYTTHSGGGRVRKSDSKLTEEDVHNIRRLRRAGHAVSKVAKMAGVPESAARQIVYNRTWKWLSTPDDVTDQTDVL